MERLYYGRWYQILQDKLTSMKKQRDPTPHQTPETLWSRQTNLSATTTEFSSSAYPDSTCFGTGFSSLALSSCSLQRSSDDEETFCVDEDTQERKETEQQQLGDSSPAVVTDSPRSMLYQSIPTDVATKMRHVNEELKNSSIFQKIQKSLGSVLPEGNEELPAYSPAIPKSSYEDS